MENNAFAHTKRLIVVSYASPLSIAAAELSPNHSVRRSPQCLSDCVFALLLKNAECFERTCQFKILGETSEVHIRFPYFVEISLQQ